MKFIIILLFLVSASFQTKWYQLENYNFEDYVKEFSKSYDADEYTQRKSIFDSNLATIKYHNILPGQTFKKGVNQFTDKTLQELQAYLGFNKQVYQAGEDLNVTLISYNSTSDLEKLKNIPSSVDWRKKGAITPVKDQGQCGSCWAFTTVEQIESYLAINTGIQETLSVGEIVSCTPNPNQCGGTGGCNGATISMGTQYVIDHGLTTEWKVPYQSYFGNVPNCSQAMYTDNVNASKLINQDKISVSSPGKLVSNSYNDVMFHLAYVGPLGISVAAGDWNSYEEGVYNGCKNYSNITLDHAVQLIGYGTDEQYGDYFLIRNSWGTSYGEEGFIRLSRNTTCGTDQFPQQNTACKNATYSPIPVCGQCGLLWGADFPINVTKIQPNTTKSTNSTNSTTSKPTNVNGTTLNSSSTNTSSSNLTQKISSILHKFL